MRFVWPIRDLREVTLSRRDEHTDVLQSGTKKIICNFYVNFFSTHTKNIFVYTFTSMIYVLCTNLALRFVRFIPYSTIIISARISYPIYLTRVSLKNLRSIFYTNFSFSQYRVNSGTYDLT